MLKKHTKCTYTVLKLIQVRPEDIQRWRQIQNPMPSPRQHMTEIYAIWEMTYGMKGLILSKLRPVCISNAIRKCHQKWTKMTLHDLFAFVC